MVKYIQTLILGVIFSFYVFPFELTFLPGINTKMALAVLGLYYVTLNFIQQKNTNIPRNILILSLIAGIVSLIGHISVAYNQTPDYAYANYIVSMWVWLSASYAVCCLMVRCYGYLSVELICNFFIGVCVAQCFLALLIEFNPLVKSVVDSFIMQNQDFLNKSERLYGIGASLDTAGIRFAAALIIVMYYMCQRTNMGQKKKITLICIYLILFIVGNMIARTTIVGVILGVLMMLFIVNSSKMNVSLSAIGIYSLIGIVGIIITIYLYNNNENIHNLLRFGFETFFNYFESGEMRSSSTDMLQNMYIFPEHLKTWIIGDGYFDNPNNIDPNYLGVSSKLGYYMGIDVGYLRFIYYFGVIGLLAISYVMIYAVMTFCNLMVGYKTLFITLLLCGFVVWLKVSTDMFFLYALFLCVANMQNKVTMKSVSR